MDFLNWQSLELQRQTRRHFFQQCQLGVGALALGSVMTQESRAASIQPHFPARAKNVIFLFMAGGPSQLDLFDDKPKLRELSGKVIPESFVE
ncbi:MAG: DUF1501 domain-containing protein, partial [Planctomycetaceae bacterium]|nr:DUF1501 domain-containing protein [Planctomycetaceae bacterium]